MRVLLRVVSILVVVFLGSETYAVNPEQCAYFEVDGKVTVCHASGSTKNPYVILRISVEACIEAHADHSADYVSVGDPSCNGLGCLPAGAPCDATVPCCYGFSCQTGVCVGPTISPTSGPVRKFITITDPKGYLSSGAVVIFYKPGQDPGTEGVMAENMTIIDAHTLTAYVPGGAIAGENFVAVKPDRFTSSYFPDFVFVVE